MVQHISVPNMRQLEYWCCLLVNRKITYKTTNTTKTAKKELQVCLGIIGIIKKKPLATCEFVEPHKQNYYSLMTPRVLQSQQHIAL